MEGYTPTDQEISNINTENIIDGLQKQGFNIGGQFSEPTKNEYIRTLVNSLSEPAKKRMMGFIVMNANFTVADVIALKTRFKNYSYLSLTSRKKFYQLKESDSDDYVADEIIMNAVLSMGKGQMQRGLLYNNSLVGRYENENENVPYHKRKLQIGSGKKLR
ncbi:hypothetical protein [Methanococcus maripaludis]|uniref:Uncharacterized protein n=1 Tax=Methanococcus maripaludis TaxID=39152 RepID=A0A7J9PNT5_METMI|nr:hypothetical protein [Methanococcus maripaludis]MBA2864434.1 hypothetical protein [Methanococcus maripaludis]